jgi:hypothetical protein
MLALRFSIHHAANTAARLHTCALQSNPEAIMQNTHSTKPEAILHVASTPSTIPPAPVSGVILARTSPRTDPPQRFSAFPRAAFWPGVVAATLRPSQVLTAAAEEIGWLYGNTHDETDPACIQARATIEAWLGEVSFEHQRTLALHHDPTPWPEELPGHEEDSFALILHALWPSTRRDFECYSPRQLELRARRRLELSIEREGPRVVDHLIRRARWQFEEAVRAYAEVRGRVPSVIPAGSAGFASAFEGDA